MDVFSFGCSSPTHPRNPQFITGDAFPSERGEFACFLYPSATEILQLWRGRQAILSSLSYHPISSSAEWQSAFASTDSLLRMLSATDAADGAKRSRLLRRPSARRCARQVTPGRRDTKRRWRVRGNQTPPRDHGKSGPGC